MQKKKALHERNADSLAETERILAEGDDTSLAATRLDQCYVCARNIAPEYFGGYKISVFCC